jgi:hypothetical protein
MKPIISVIGGGTCKKEDLGSAGTILRWGFVSNLADEILTLLP